MTEDKVDVADLGAERVIGAEAEAGEVFGAEVGDDGFETVATAATAFFTEANLTKIEIEVVADDEDVFGRDFVKMREGLDGFAGIVIEVLGFDKDIVAGFEPECAKFRLFPV